MYLSQRYRPTRDTYGAEQEELATSNGQVRPQVPKLFLKDGIECQSDEEAVLPCTNKYLELYKMWSGAAVGCVYPPLDATHSLVLHQHQLQAVPILSGTWVNLIYDSSRSLTHPSVQIQEYSSAVADINNISWL